MIYNMLYWFFLIIVYLFNNDCCFDMVVCALLIMGAKIGIFFKSLFFDKEIII